jgi:hypothetical protein
MEQLVVGSLGVPGSLQASVGTLLEYQRPARFFGGERIEKREGKKKENN